MARFLFLLSNAVCKIPWHGPYNLPETFILSGEPLINFLLV